MVEIHVRDWPIPSRISIYLMALSGSLILVYSIFWINIKQLPDYENYLLWAVEFQEKSWSEIDLVEFFSFAQIKFFGSLGNSVDIGLQKLYVLNAFIAAIGLFALSIRYAQTFSGVFLVYVLFGPLMSYVTLRATPAYLLVSWFILIQSGAFRKLLLMLIAVFYHVTAILPALLTVGVSSLKLKDLFNLENKKILVNFLIVSIFTLGVSVGLIWISGIGDAIVYHFYTLIDGTNKFSEYIETASFYRSSAHFGYFVFVLVLTCFYLHLTSSSINNLWWVIVFSLITFIFLSFSPVVAYRFSIFFLLPVFLTFPKNKNLLETCLSYLMVLAGLAVGIVQAVKLFTD